MTIPIIPGPFSFLATVGEAAGRIGEAIEERKRYQQQVARLGSDFLITQILRGADPALLDHPDVQRMMRTAYGFAIPSQMARLVGAQERLTGEAAQAAIGAGVPALGAQTQRAQLELTRRGAEAEAAAGVPEAAAGAKRTELDVAKQETELRSKLVSGVEKTLGADPQFRRLAEMAYMGILPYKISEMTSLRAMMSEQHRLAAEELRGLATLLNTATQQWKEAYQTWQASLGTARLKGEEKEFLEANPEPQFGPFLRDRLEDAGLTTEEFARLWRERAFRLGAAPEAPKPAAPVPDEYRPAIDALRGMEPEELDATFKRFKSERRSPLQIKIMLSYLKAVDPQKYEQARAAYNKYADEKDKIR